MQWTKVVLLLLVIASGTVASAATAESCKTPKSPPLLTTAEKVAIESQEQEKIKANQQWQAADHLEDMIEAEFAAAHPGWHIEKLHFTVVEDTPKPEKKK